MALSGSFSGSIVGGKYKLRVDWSATQNISNNTSKVTMVLYLVQASSWSLNISARADNPASIAGTSYTWDAAAINNGGGKTTKLATITSGNIAHNSDGTKSISLSATFGIRATISGTYYSNIQASTTVTLNTIPRATQPKLSASSVNMGSAVTISLPRASSNFTHDLAYRLGSGSWVSINTGVGTSYSWTVPDLASQLPNATSGAVTVRCITKNGGTTIGTKTVSMTANVPSSVIPTISSVSTAEATSGLAAQFGEFIQNKTTLAVTISAAGAKGSTIKAYKTTLLGKTYTTRTFTSGVLTSSGSVTLSTQVQDSRGRWSAAKKTTITVQAYAAPKIQQLTAYRVDSSGNPDEQGDRLALTCRWSVTSLSSKNTASAVIEYKRSSEDTWTTLQTNTALSVNTTIKPTTVFSTDYQYDVRVTLTDWFNGRATHSATLPSGAVVFDILANGKGVGIGKTAEAEGIDLGWGFVGGVSNIVTNYTGQWKMPNGPLIQWGTISLTPTAANTPISGTVTFPHEYKIAPSVFLTVLSGAPHVCAVSVTNRTYKGVDIVLTRQNTTTSIINWLAIGSG